MAKTRREFTPEFRREAVALLESSGRPQMQIAAELGIQLSMLRQWRTALSGVAFSPRSAGPTRAPSASLVASPSDQAAEIARLRRELDRTRMERDVLNHEPDRLLLRQRPDGELLPHPQGRACPPVTMGNPGGGAPRSVRLHRELL